MGKKLKDYEVDAAIAADNMVQFDSCHYCGGIEITKQGDFAMESINETDFETICSECSAEKHDQLVGIIEREIDGIFEAAHQHIWETKSGDIYPEQQQRLDKITEQLIELVEEQARQNLT